MKLNRSQKKSRKILLIKKHQTKQLLIFSWTSYILPFLENSPSPFFLSRVNTNNVNIESIYKLEKNVNNASYHFNFTMAFIFFWAVERLKYFGVKKKEREKSKVITIFWWVPSANVFWKPTHINKNKQKQFDFEPIRLGKNFRGEIMFMICKRTNIVRKSWYIKHISSDRKITYDGEGWQVF